MLGYCENPADDKWEAPGIINKTSAKALIERFNTMEKAMQAFAELKITGKHCWHALQSSARTNILTAWQISGINISVW